jgi:hypothetical protein
MKCLCFVGSSRTNLHKNSITNLANPNELFIGEGSGYYQQEVYASEPAWKGSQGNFSSISAQEIMLGPGQVQPKNYYLKNLRYGELKLGFTINKSLLEMQIICAKGVAPLSADPPDTYVKCYLKDGNDRMRQKKKTDICRHTIDPTYNQCIKYSVSPRSNNI